MRQILINHDHGLVLLHTPLKIGTKSSVVSADPKRYYVNEDEWTEGCAVLENDQPLNESLYDRITSE